MSAETTEEWTDADSIAANIEGWDLFDSAGSDNGPLQLCRIDDPALWRGERNVRIDMEWLTDEQAWEYAWQTNSPLHQKAFAVLQRENPQEYANIEKWCTPRTATLIYGDWQAVTKALTEAGESSILTRLQDQLD